MRKLKPRIFRGWEISIWFVKKGKHYDTNGKPQIKTGSFEVKDKLIRGLYKAGYICNASWK